jgi:hypothetical protein
MVAAIERIGRGADCFEGDVFAMPHIDPAWRGFFLDFLANILLLPRLDSGPISSSHSTVI